MRIEADQANSLTIAGCARFFASFIIDEELKKENGCAGCCCEKVADETAELDRKRAWAAEGDRSKPPMEQSIPEAEPDERLKYPRHEKRHGKHAEEMKSLFKKLLQVNTSLEPRASRMDPLEGRWCAAP